MKPKTELRHKFNGKGYVGLRDPKTGMTPREKLYDIQTRRQMLELAKDQKQLVYKAEVEAGMRECANVIQSNLYGVLPSRCATELGGKKLTAEQVRQVVLGIVGDMVGGWISAEIVAKEAAPK